MSAPRLLVLDAYSAEGREALVAAGGTAAGELYARRLRALVPRALVEVGTPAEADWELPGGAALGDFHGLVWTGSNLTIHVEGDARVQRQLALARAAYAAGVPSFGSCWAAQIAVTAAGGRCARNPRGREFGISRAITPTAEGSRHPLLAARRGAFDALTSHEDEVVELPPGAALLATNAWTRVQAVAVENGRGSFWAVQYHPEYDLHEVAALGRLRAPGLVAQGFFADEEAAKRWADDLERLQLAPDDAARRATFGATDDVLNPQRLLAEVKAWLEAKVLPRAA